MITRVIFVSLALTLLTSEVRADPCDDAGLKDRFLKQCKSWLERNCKRRKGKSLERCVKTAIDNSQKRQGRIEKKKADGAAAAGEWGICTSEEYEKSCSQLRKGRSDICDYARAEPRLTHASNEPLEKSLELWLGRYRGYAELKKNIATFVEKYGKCENAPRGHRPSCNFDGNEQKACLEAEGKFKENWAKWVNRFEKESLPRMDQDIKRMKSAKTAPSTSNSYAIEKPIVIIAGIKQINDGVEWVRTDPKQVSRLEKQIKAKQKGYTKALDRLLKKVKCPVKGRGGKFYKILLAHGKRSKKPGSTLKETFKHFKVTGKAKLKAEWKVTHEDLPAKACVVQERNGHKTCRIFDMTFRRSKPDGGKWGAWDFYSIGGGGMMSCRNLR